MLESIIGVVGFIFILFVVILTIASRYRKCPPNKILVVHGKTKGQTPSKCVHGGGTFIIPVFQGYGFLDLNPISMDIDLKNALSEQNIRISMPSTFTIGVSSDEEFMQKAAERLLGLSQQQIVEQASDIIFGQLRSVVSGLTIEEINTDRIKFLANIKDSVTPELNKIGLTLINVNIRDITDASQYLESIGRKAAAVVVNQALIDVAEQEKKGQTGKATADKEREVSVAVAHAESVKGQKQAEADKRVYVQEQEAVAIKGEKQAEADQRIFVKGQEASAVKGETDADSNIADYQAGLKVRQVAARKTAEIAKNEAEIEIQRKLADAERERQIATEVVPVEINKKKIELQAQADANKTRELATGDADAMLLKYTAEAAGIQKLYEAKAEGFRNLVVSCGGDTGAAARFLMIEKLEKIVEMQAEAIKNIKIDKVQVWDSTSGNTQGFMSSMLGALPPLNKVLDMAGLNLPEFLGTSKDETVVPSAEAEAKVEGKLPNIPFKSPVIKK
jgi:flotillin